MNFLNKISITSQRPMNENPTKSPRAPPTSDTNDDRGYISISVIFFTVLLARRNLNPVWLFLKK